MNEELNKKLNDLLSGIDREKLSGMKRSVGKMLEGKNGEMLKRRIGTMDKDKLLDEFMRLDSNELKRLIGKANVNELDGTEIEEVLKKMK